MSKFRKNKISALAEDNQRKISSFFQQNSSCSKDGGAAITINRPGSSGKLETSDEILPLRKTTSNVSVSASKTPSLELPTNSSNQIKDNFPGNFQGDCELSSPCLTGGTVETCDTPKHRDSSCVDMSDSEVIPDTPEETLPKIHSRKTYPRSFLSTNLASSNQTGNSSGIQKKTVVKKTKKVKSLESRLKSTLVENRNQCVAEKTPVEDLFNRNLCSGDAKNSGKDLATNLSLSSESDTHQPENRNGKRFSRSSMPVPKRSDNRPTPEKYSEAREPANPVPKRLSFDTSPDSGGDSGVISSDRFVRKQTVSSRPSGLPSSRCLSKEGVNQSANLDLDENLSVILKELTESCPPLNRTADFENSLKTCGSSWNTTADFSGLACVSRREVSDEPNVAPEEFLDDSGFLAEIDLDKLAEKETKSVEDDETEWFSIDEYAEPCKASVCEDKGQSLPVDMDCSVDIQDFHDTDEHGMVRSSQSVAIDVSQDKTTEPSDVPPREKSFFVEEHPLSPSADQQELQSSSESSGNLCQEFEKLSPFKNFCNSRTEALQAAQDTSPPPFHQYGRHRVMSVTRNRAETLVDVECIVTGKCRKAVLEGYWQDALIRCGDVVNIIGSFDDSDVCYVTDDKNFIIVNPDHLISGTTIVGSMHCMRRSVLNEKFKISGKKSPFLFYGSIIHAIFQRVLLKRMQMKECIENDVETVLQQSTFLHEMYAQGLKEQAIRDEIGKYVPQMKTFISKYVKPKDVFPGHQELKDDILVTEVKDIEENIWSPRFGIKGKIDLTVGVKIHDRRTKQLQSKVVPLELKTGKTSFSAEHQGQVTLYTMMFADRRADPESGLLVYLKDLSTKMIPANYANKRGLIQLRNELAFYLRQSLEKEDHSFQVDSSDPASVDWTLKSLPEPLNEERICSNCEQLMNCSLYRQSVECKPLNRTMENLVPSALAHLAPSHLDFFSLWCKLIHLEMSADMSRAEGAPVLWMNTGWQRELKGKCLSGMILIHDDCKEVGKDNFVQVFRRSPSHKSYIALNDVGILLNDSLIVSSEDGTYIAMATGIVTLIDEHRVVVVTDRDLRQYSSDLDTTYRLDKCDTFNSMTINLSNLSRLMENSTSSTKLRQIIIDKKCSEFNLTLSKTVIQRVRHIMKQLNKPQQQAILKVLMSKDYVLIKGYPGTGKTSTIVAIIRILVLSGLSVLLASYTHSAVDNILLKLIQHDIDFLRLGRLDRVHPSVHPYAAVKLTENFKTVAELTQFYQSKPVIATTCLGTNHPIFSQRTFDVCIVDEASQVLLPACLGPLFVATRFVLVGDPKQLPPLVQSKEARDLGLGQSLFAFLDQVGGATYELTLQYRMNSEIMYLSNCLIYDGALQCGNQTVADSRLSIRNPPSQDHLEEWQEKCLSSELDSSVLWLNTDPIFRLAAANPLHPSGLKSNVEATLVLHLVQLFVRAGVPEDCIGVITPFRRQVNILRQQLGRSLLSQTEVNTVDQYQGRDKSVIIVSFVRSKSSDNEGSEILKDARRINVAMTRARNKIIFIGSIDSLNIYEPLQQLVTKILRPNQILELTNLPDSL